MTNLAPLAPLHFDNIDQLKLLLVNTSNIPDNSFFTNILAADHRGATNDKGIQLFALSGAGLTYHQGAVRWSPSTYVKYDGLTFCVDYGRPLDNRKGLRLWLPWLAKVPPAATSYNPSNEGYGGANGSFRFAKSLYLAYDESLPGLTLTTASAPNPSPSGYKWIIPTVWKIATGVKGRATLQIWNLGKNIDVPDDPTRDQVVTVTGASATGKNTFGWSSVDVGLSMISNNRMAYNSFYLSNRLSLFPLPTRSLSERSFPERSQLGRPQMDSSQARTRGQTRTVVEPDPDIALICAIVAMILAIIGIGIGFGVVVVVLQQPQHPMSRVVE